MTMLNSKRPAESSMSIPVPAAAGSDVNLIGAGTLIQGDVQSSNDIRVDGKIKGVISTTAKIVVGPGGEVEGDVVCRSADIMGKLTGTIKVEELLYLKGNAVINGDVFTNQLEMEPTARFNGRCQMEVPDRDIIMMQEHAQASQELEVTA